MLSWPPSVRIYLAAGPADMRRGFDGLARMATEVIRQDPLLGALFVSRNRKGDRVKVLYWAGDGFALWYRRLERGTFRFPACDGPSGGRRIEQRPAVTAAAAAVSGRICLIGRQEFQGGPREHEQPWTRGGRSQSDSRGPSTD